MEYGYKVALDAVDSAMNASFNIGKLKVNDFSELVVSNNSLETIRRALMIADKLMQEPSDRMDTAGEFFYWPEGEVCPTNIFKAMRDQLLIEVDQELAK